MTEYEYLHNRHFQVKLRVLSNRMYYQERQRIFEMRDNGIRAASIIAGSAAIVSIANQEVLKPLLAIITVGNIISLVFGFGNKSRDSAKRHSDWTKLEEEISNAGARDFTEDQLNLWEARCNSIESGEPAPNSKLFERCYSRACTALGGTPIGEASWSDRNLPPIFIP